MKRNAPSIEQPQSAGTAQGGSRPQPNRVVMATQAALESGAPQGEIHEVGVEASSLPRFRTVLTRRVRYWTDGAVIGSKTFLREVEAKIRDAS